MSTMAPPPEAPKAAQRQAPRRSAIGNPAPAQTIWRNTAVVSALFTIAVALVMLAGYRRSVAEDPLRVSQWNGYRERLHANPKDDEARQQIRKLDLSERERHFTRLRRNRTGAWLLAIGASVFVVSALRSVKKQPTVPREMLSPAEVEEETGRARLATASAGAVIVISLAVVGITMRKPSEPTQASSGPAAAVPQPAITAEMLTRHWPRFRGWGGSGASPASIPASWDFETGENIAWKVAQPLNGNGSPVIWGARIFLSGGAKEARALFCLDAANGSVIWRLPVDLLTAEAKAALEIPELSGAASATATVDEQRVYAIFATGELVAADHSGRLLWSKNYGKLDNLYGHATSLITHGAHLIVQLDQGGEEDGKSRLYALDGATGKVVWQQTRHVGASWASPIIINAAGKDQIVTLGEPWLISYNAADGKELWKYEGMGSDITPSPVFSGGLVYAISPSQRLFALRPDGQGDITKTHVAWGVEENVPDIASPIAHNGLVFTLETGGNVTCRDAASGAKIWEHAYEGEFQASLSIAGNHLYVFSTDGRGYTLQAGKEYKELGQSKLGEPVRSSPAFAGESMFIRGATNLFCIRSSKGGTK